MVRRWESGIVMVVVVLGLLALAAPAATHEPIRTRPQPAPAGAKAATLPTEHCGPIASWTICWHADVPPPGAPRTPRSLPRMVRDAGGRALVRSLRSGEPGAVIDVDATELGGVAGPADLPVARSQGGIVPAADATPSADATPGVLCIGNGTSGNRVQAVYAYVGTSRASRIVPLIRRWAADVETTVRLSSKAAGGVRHVRWVHTQGCVLSVMVVKVSKQAIGSIDRFFNELAGKGLRRTDRRYLAWFDANALCGVGTMLPDDRGAKTNPNNGYPYGPSAWTRVDRGCWGLRTSQDEAVEAHELFHNLGAVQYSSPNSSRAGHCNDEYDVMCYDDGGSRSTMRINAPGRSNNAVLDCGHNDYFDPTPASGTYLARKWNTARSSFLDTGSGAPPVIVDIGGTIPDTGLSDPTALVTLTIDAVSDAPIASVTVRGSMDDSIVVQELPTTGSDPLKPRVALARGHRWFLQVSVTDAKGRTSALPRCSSPSSRTRHRSCQGSRSWPTRRMGRP